MRSRDHWCCQPRWVEEKWVAEVDNIEPIFTQIPLDPKSRIATVGSPAVRTDGPDGICHFLEGETAASNAEETAVSSDAVQKPAERVVSAEIMKMQICMTQMARPG